jgi:hypothetical protein
MITRNILLAKQPEQKWIDAYDWLFMVTQNALDNGSAGVNKVCVQLMPIWDRFDDGERTDELYKLMMETK